MPKDTETKIPVTVVHMGGCDECQADDPKTRPSFAKPRFVTYETYASNWDLAFAPVKGKPN
jgi:hypothetical protein